MSRQEVLLRVVVPAAEIGLTCRYLLAQHPGAAVVVGDATACREVSRALLQANPGLTLLPVAETDSTLAARALYFEDYPPRGLRRLVPPGMRVPPRPVDDYAAVVLARRHLEQQQGW